MVESKWTSSGAGSRASRVATALALLSASSGVSARHGEAPYSIAYPAKVGIAIPTEELPPVDALEQRALADQAMNTPGPHAKRLRVANGVDVSIDSHRDGRWESLADGSHLWRMGVRAAGATDLRVQFTHLTLPEGTTLHVIGADHGYQGPYTGNDVTSGRFDSPVVAGDDATIELHVPATVQPHAVELELTRVGVGFRDLFRREKGGPGPGTSGACNVNVACPLGHNYPGEIAATAYYEFADDDDHGSYLCSGTLLADVPRDRRNYFLSAAHCVDSATEAASMVIYWNYQSTQCSTLSAPAGGFFNDDLHGASLRASRADVDFTLVELTQTPESSWQPYYAGWDAGGMRPSGTIGIHHPNGDVKKITAGPAPSVTYSCIADSGPDDSHWMTGPYSQGTTEGGSSGSGLFASSASGSRAGLLIGTLSGGAAACSSTSPTQPNASTDCYGRFAVGWNGPAATSRLHDWLDPADTGVTELQGGDTTAIAVPGHSTHAIPAGIPHGSQRR